MKSPFSDSVMGAMIHLSLILRSNQAIMGYPDCDEGAAFLPCAPLRSRNHTATKHFGGTLYTGLFREEQSHFERRKGLSPIFTLEQHPRTTDVSGGTAMPITITPRSIPQRDLQFEALGSRLFARSNPASIVKHSLFQSWLISSGFTRGSQASRW